MQSWVVYGLVASVCFGVVTVLFKIAQQKGNLTPYYTSFLFGIGVMIVFGIFFLFNPGYNIQWKSNGIAIAAGILWGIGMLVVAIAISKNVEVARLAPIFNTNTLITVVLGIILLHEIPNASQMFRVIAGAVLIVVGAILVSV